MRDIRHDAFAHIQRLPLSYLDRQPTGDVVSRVIADVDQFADGLLMGFTQLFTGVVTIVGTLFFMLSVNAVITFVGGGASRRCRLLVANFIARRTYTMFKQQIRTRARSRPPSSTRWSANQKVVQRLHASRRRPSADFDEVNERLRKSSACAPSFYSSITNPATRFVNSAGLRGRGRGGRAGGA